jgi:hypothetical protein
MEMRIEIVPLNWAEGCNIIVGQAHFIKTAEDIYEAIASSFPGAKFGLAFCEASGPRLVRTEGSDPALVDDAARCAMAVGAGHSFYVVLRDSFPINVLDRIKDCREVAQVFCATANPLSVIVARAGGGAGILGVIDGESPLGVEDTKDKEARRGFLRTIGYKL